MKNYNLHLSELRKRSGLTREELAEKVGISSLAVYLYENGYFRPSKRNLKKLSEFFKEDISIEGDDAYPVPVKEHELKSEKKPLKVRRIVFGALSFFTLACSMVGVFLFNRSVNNYESYYGETYNQIRDVAFKNGQIGHDLITNLEFYHLDKEDHSQTASLMFYKIDSLLYFNEATFSTSTMSEDYGIERIHIQFGSNLGVSSYRGRFNFSGTKNAVFFSCEFDYEGKALTKVDNFKYNIDAGQDIPMSRVLNKVNVRLSEARNLFTSLLSENLGRDSDFYEDFLSAREKGRVVNFNLQIIGLVLLIPHAILFFIFFPLFLHSLIANVRPRLVTSNLQSKNKKYKKLPKDLKIEFGIPDLVLVYLGQIVQYGSIALMLFGFIANLSIPVLRFITTPNFFAAMRASMLAGIFIEHFVILGRIKKATTLFTVVIKNIFVFLFIATMETILIALTDAWGYDFAGIIYNYVPSNVYQVIAVQYLIFLFLFFQPPFLNSHKKSHRILWHSLSLIPLAFLIVSYFVSNQYALVYGVHENIFVNFWFPNGFLPLSIVSVLFMYGVFVLRIIIEKNYGKHNGQIYMYGDRYGMIENVYCAILILIVAIVDLFLQGNQIAYYLGLGYNFWILGIIPLVGLCKYSPNTQQVFLTEPRQVIEEEIQ